MLHSATGFLETNNLSSAIEAADQMLKAANIENIEKINLGDSLIVLILKGDAPSVEAALLVGESVAKKSGSYLRAHLIPELNDQVEDLIMKGVRR